MSNTNSWSPRPQTPEEVSEGLREAFKKFNQEKSSSEEHPIDKNDLKSKVKSIVKRGHGTLTEFSLLDLFSRIESLEANMNDIEQALNEVDEMFQEDSTNTDVQPSDGLVERLMNLLGHYGDGTARSAIREIADAVAATGMLGCTGIAQWLRDEATKMLQENSTTTDVQPADSLVKEIESVFLSKSFTADDPLGIRAILTLVANWMETKADIASYDVMDSMGRKGVYTVISMLRDEALR